MARMTDHTQYTGSHKERFDDSGKGKGIAGREEVAAKDGYVQGYKDRGTYDKKVENTEGWLQTYQMNRIGPHCKFMDS